MIKPEILSPAGDKERLDAALMFGADAVYLGADAFTMRAAPQNFRTDELAQTVKKCHEKNVKVYLTVNTLPRNNEISLLPSYLEQWEDAGIDGFIVADIGVLSLCKKNAPKVPVHISTQAGIVNYVTANEFYNMGASRIVTARELSLNEIAEIRAKIPKELEIECFVHGAMCVSFSGRCLLSNYLLNRDANRGECAQPCRWEYAIMEKKRDGIYFPISDTENGTYILNSKDMCMIEHIPELISAGINSFKIEGRAKSAYYAAVITNAYKSAVDEYMQNPSPDFKPSKWIIDECYKVSYRDYCTGFYFDAPNESAQVSFEGGYIRHCDIAAVVTKCQDGFIFAEQRNKFCRGEMLDALEPNKSPVFFKAEEIFDLDGNALDSLPHPMMQFKIKSDLSFPAGTMLRKEK